MQVVETHSNLLGPTQDLLEVNDVLLQVVEETAIDCILSHNAIVG